MSGDDNLWYSERINIMKFFTKNIIGTILIGVAFFGGFYFNDYLNQKQSLTLEAAFNGIDLGLMKKTLETILNNYVDPQQIDKEKLSYGAISGMVKALGDPYTVFFNPQESKEFREDLSGTFNGIGVQIDAKDGKVKVVAPIKGTPAFRAGILAGDTIFEVDKQPISDLSIEQVISMIKGPKGTKVVIGVFRGENNQIKTFEIIRDEIVMPSVDLEIKTTFNGKKVALLTIYHFSENTVQAFKSTINEMLAQNISGIVLDLRNNPGGLLDQTDEIASWFLKKGDIVLSEQDKNGNKIEHKSKGPGILAEIPTVILINQGTASAAEILSGALRDNRQIDLIGEKTFGKGVVQKLFNLENGSSLKITVAKWYTPNGELIQEKGIQPSIEVKLTQEDIEKENDLQLKKALEQLDNLIQ